MKKIRGNENPPATQPKPKTKPVGQRPNKVTIAGYPAWCQRWIESERGWGQSDDGCSLHFKKEDVEKYVREYTKDRTGPVPDVYDRPDGQPYEILVSARLAARIEDSEFGIRVYEDKPERGKLLK